MEFIGGDSATFFKDRKMENVTLSKEQFEDILNRISSRFIEPHQPDEDHLISQLALNVLQRVGDFSYSRKDCPKFDDFCTQIEAVCKEAL